MLWQLSTIASALSYYEKWIPDDVSTCGDVDVCSRALQAFCSFTSSAKELFAKSLLFSPTPQIWVLYSIIGLTTAVYSRCVCLKEGPYINAIIYNAAANVAVPLWVTCVIYVFQFSLKSI